MKIQRKNLHISALLFAAAAQFMGTAAQAAIVELNGNCKVGSCSTLQQDAITFGNSVSSTDFSFTQTLANTDAYGVNGSFAASYGSGGTVFSVNLAVTYLGNSTSSASQADSFTVDVLQDIFDNRPGSFDGTYTESIPVSIFGPVGPGSNVSAQLLWDGQSVGMVGPFVGDGTFSGSNSANLTGLNGNTLAGDFQFNYNFAAGTDPGAGSTAPNSTPEPSESIPAAVAAGAGFAFLRKRRKAKSAELPDRREAVEKLGRFAAYAAPFTLLAFSKKADAATGTGPVKHLKKR